ncbi:MAG: galactose mutarotase [Clostridia bacterium]|nr:galactose mutarotase [Clostridia bacterium]
MQIKNFGKLPDGREATLFILENGTGAYAAVTNVGASIVSVVVPDKNGNLGDVVLGYTDGAKYLTKGAYHGATVGRVANRIEDARFTLEGVEYILKPNYNGQHMLHGGEIGLDSKLFDAEVCGDTVIMKTVLPDGEDGFPGNIEITVKYDFDAENRLNIEYFAECDKTTPINLINHSYFNLNVTGDICSHELTINSDEYYPLADNGMVTGEKRPAVGTMNFKEPKIVGSDIDADCPQIKLAGGYDHNYFLQDGKDFVLAASIKAPESGRIMRVYTDMPGILFYSGNFLHTHEVEGKLGRAYMAREGFCLETNYCPNALKCPQVKQPILKKGEKYHHKTVYEFAV